MLRLPSLLGAVLACSSCFATDVVCCVCAGIKSFWPAMLILGVLSTLSFVWLITEGRKCTFFASFGSVACLPLGAGFGLFACLALDTPALMVGFAAACV